MRSTEAAEKIPLQRVESSNIAALGYNGPKHIAAVQFKTGSIFHFAELPPDVMQRWVLAESIGRFFHQEIKGKFHGQKMTGPCPRCGWTGWIGDVCEDCGTARYEEGPRKEQTPQ